MIYRTVSAFRGWTLLVVALACSGCSGLRAYSHDNFPVDQQRLRSVVILYPIIDVKEEGWSGGRKPMPRLAAALQFQALDELEHVFHERGYLIHKLVYGEQELAQRPDLRNDLRMVLGRFADIAYDLRRRKRWRHLAFSVGAEAQHITAETGSDAVILLKCYGAHRTPAATIREAAFELLQDALTNAHSYQTGLLYKSEVLIQIAAVRSHDGTVMWYGDNVGTQGMNVTKETVFRRSVRAVAEQFPARKPGPLH